MRFEQTLDFGPVTGLKMGYSPIGKPLMNVICYQVDNILIDTGAKNTRKTLVKLLNIDAVDKILLTHYHEDHAGNAAFLQDEYQLPIFAHPLTCESLASRIKLQPYEYFMWGGLEPAEASPITNTVSSENYQFEIYHTPGHSHDHVVFLEPNQGWLFSGDMFLGPMIKYFRFDEDILQTMESLELILSLEFEQLFCGHNPQRKNPKKPLQKKWQYLKNIYDGVAELSEKGYSKQAIIKQLIHKKEHWAAKIVTLGDASYKNLLLSSYDNIQKVK